MNRHSQIAAWFGATLGTAGALVMLAVGAHASDYRGAVTEEFHQTYTLTPDGRVELDNINGPVHISTWDRNEVKVDAIKSASTKERLDEARIEIDAGKDYVSIRTKYRDRDQTWNGDNWHNNPPSVEYTVTVPLGAHLDEIKLINGSLDVAGVTGEVRASCINGRLEAKDLAGRAKEGKLKLNEFQGGGFTISNLGMFGVNSFSAIINPPQAMILAVGVGEERVVARKGQMVIGQMMTCTLAVDHRVVDGAMGAQFLQTLRAYIEQPAAMLV